MGTVGYRGTGCPLGLWALHVRSMMRILSVQDLTPSPDLHSTSGLFSVGFGMVQPSRRNPNILS